MRPTTDSSRGIIEVDTVVSCISGTEGPLVLLDRCTQIYYIEKICKISPSEIIKALKRLRKRHVLYREIGDDRQWLRISRSGGDEERCSAATSTTPAILPPLKSVLN